MNWSKISDKIEAVLENKLALVILNRKQFVFETASKYLSVEQRRELSPDIIDRVLELLYEEGEDWHDSEGQFQLEVSARIFLETLIEKKLASKK